MAYNASRAFQCNAESSRRPSRGCRRRDLKWTTLWIYSFHVLRGPAAVTAGASLAFQKQVAIKEAFLKRTAVAATGSQPPALVDAVSHTQVAVMHTI